MLAEINSISGLGTAFVAADGISAYDEAVREVGFEVPSTTDVDRQEKYQWLIARMRRWFYLQVYQRNMLNFDISDLKRSQIPKLLAARIKDIDADFVRGKESPESAHLFLSAGNIFGEDIVMTSGFLDNRHGEGIEGSSHTTATKPKQPTATQRVIDGVS